jgi:hypothetical protein
MGALHTLCEQGSLLMSSSIMEGKLVNKIIMGGKLVNCRIIIEAALAAIENHRSLPLGQAENFASKFAKGTDRLNIQQGERTASLALLPLTLLEPLIEADVGQSLSSRKRAMTGLEAAEVEEAEKR